MTVWNLLRVYDVALWGVTVMLAARVLALYFAAHRHAASDLERRHAAGIVPRHVWTIASSYIILAGASVAENVSHIGDGPTPHLFASASGFSLGVYALWTIMGYERRRVRVLDALGEFATQDSASSPR